MAIYISPGQIEAHNGAFTKSSTSSISCIVLIIFKFENIILFIATLALAVQFANLASVCSKCGRVCLWTMLSRAPFSEHAEFYLILPDYTLITNHFPNSKNDLPSRSCCLVLSNSKNGRTMDLKYSLIIFEQIELMIGIL